MIDIYNEIGYVKDILQKGLDTNNWLRDVKLLVRYYKQEEGLKKKDIRPLIIEKCKEMSFYNHIQDYKRTNKAIDDAFKKDEPLRDIDEIEIPREVVEWFKDLKENYVLSADKVQELQEKRPKVKVTAYPMNLDRIKMLFTLYIWTLIQSHYLERPEMHYVNNYLKKFKKEANLKVSFSVKRERDFLYDLGFIYVNYALGIDACFIRENEVFNTPITDENRVVLKGEDLYNPGYFIEKQIMGSFVCQNCGREIAYKGKGKGIRNRKYCDECSKLLHVSIKSNDKANVRICECCGEEFTVDNPKSKQRFCWRCQTNRYWDSKKVYKQKIRNKEKGEKNA